MRRRRSGTIIITFLIAMLALSLLVGLASCVKFRFYALPYNGSYVPSDHLQSYYSRCHRPSRYPPAPNGMNDCWS